MIICYRDMIDVRVDCMWYTIHISSVRPQKQDTLCDSVSYTTQYHINIFEFCFRDMIVLDHKFL